MRNQLQDLSQSVSFEQSCHAATKHPHDDLISRLKAAEKRCVEQKNQFELARQQWAEEKAKVLKYQERLQNCYVQMLRHARVLEEKVQSLTLQLEHFGEDDALRIKPWPTIDEEVDHFPSEV